MITLGSWKDLWRRLAGGASDGVDAPSREDRPGGAGLRSDRGDAASSGSGGSDAAAEAPPSPPRRPVAAVRPCIDLEVPRDQWLPRLAQVLEEHDDDLVGALLAINEAFGFLPRDVVEELARRTHTPLARLHGIASYYDRFRLEPVGRHRLSVCLGTACHVAGGPTLVDALTHRLGVAAGGTSADRLFTLETVACVGCCSLAPVLTVDGEVRGRVRNAEVADLVSGLREVSA